MEFTALSGSVGRTYDCNLQVWRSEYVLNKSVFFSSFVPPVNLYRSKLELFFKVDVFSLVGDPHAVTTS